MYNFYFQGNYEEFLSYQTHNKKNFDSVMNVVNSNSQGN